MIFGIVKVFEESTARDRAVKSNRFWIDQGRKFQWVKRNEVPPTEILCKKPRKRPTRRGTRKKYGNRNSVLNKAITTFKCLAPHAPHLNKLPKVVEKLVYLMHKIIIEDGLGQFSADSKYKPSEARNQDCEAVRSPHTQVMKGRVNGSY